MASALDAVLQIRASEEAKRQFDQQQITHAVDMFQQARQAAIENKMKQELISSEVKKNLNTPNLDALKIQRENRLINQQQFSNSTKLRQEFINRPEVKDYMTVSPNIEAMDSLLSKSLSGDIQNASALDQGLITMYNKLTDPQSVVRESEYARTPENIPFVNRFKGAIQKINEGGAGLTNDDRKALVQGAKIIANERGNQYQKTLGEYKGTAAEYGLDEKLITRDMPDFKPYDTKIESVGKKNDKSSSINKEAAIAELKRRGIIK